VNERSISESRLSRPALFDGLTAFMVLTIVAVLSFINIYVPGSLPIWDGDIYNQIITAYISHGYAFHATAGDFLLNIQPRASYGNRIAYVWAIAGLHYVTGLPLTTVYPLFDLVCAIVAAIYLFRFCHYSAKISYACSIGAGIWFLLSPATLVIYQVLAHPELMMLALVSMAVYYYSMRRHTVAAVLLFISVLAKQSALLVIMFVVVDVLLNARVRPRPIANIVRYTLAAAASLALPGALIDNSHYRFSWHVVTTTIIGLNGHLFYDLLYNFEVLWILFLAGLPLISRKCHFNVSLLASCGVVMSLLGSTDWFRTWFSILFFVVLPVSGRALDYLTSGIRMNYLRPLGATWFAIMLMKRKPFLDLGQVYGPPNYWVYGCTIVLVLILYVIAARTRGSGTYAPDGQE
jgi:hypothetical protein